MINETTSLLKSMPISSNTYNAVEENDRTSTNDILKTTFLLATASTVFATVNGFSTLVINKKNMEIVTKLFLKNMPIIIFGGIGELVISTITYRFFLRHCNNLFSKERALWLKIIVDGGVIITATALTANIFLVLDESINDTAITTQTYVKTIGQFSGFTTMLFIIGKWLYPNLSKIGSEWINIIKNKFCCLAQPRTMSNLTLFGKTLLVNALVAGMSVFQSFSSRIANEGIFLTKEIIPDIAIKSGTLLVLEICQAIILAKWNSIKNYCCSMRLNCLTSLEEDNSNNISENVSSVASSCGSGATINSSNDINNYGAMASAIPHQQEIVAEVHCSDEKKEDVVIIDWHVDMARVSNDELSFNEIATQAQREKNFFASV